MSSDELAKIAALVRSGLPSATGAFAVGSYVANYGAVADIDLIALVTGGAGEKQRLGRIEGYPVEATCFDPLLPKVLRARPTETFLLLRSIRQITFGIPLFGIDECLRFRSGLNELTIETRFLIELLDAKAPCLLRLLDAQEFTLLEFFHVVENVVFVACCAFSCLGPRKPKHYLREAKESLPNAFAPLLCKIARFSFDHLTTCILDGGVLASRELPPDPILNTLIRDTVKLRSVGRLEDAQICLLAYLCRSKNASDSALGPFRKYDSFLQERLDVSVPNNLGRSLVRELERADGQIQNMLKIHNKISAAQPISLADFRGLPSYSEDNN